PPVGEEVKINPKNILNIFINERGGILIDKDVVELKDIRSIVEQRIAENDKLIVSIQMDKNATYRMMIDVLDEAKLAEAPKISLAVPEF
ncbi:biopolymer transporter ExbD, partial [bacterium]|nr:biopolymer transporter ExbD [bacterium]